MESKPAPDKSAAAAPAPSVDELRDALVARVMFPAAMAKLASLGVDIGSPERQEKYWRYGCALLARHQAEQLRKSASVDQLLERRLAELGVDPAAEAAVDKAAGEYLAAADPELAQLAAQFLRQQPAA